VLSSSVVTNPRVPRVIRHSLNLESGLNDGLALPPVLALTAALAANTHFVWWKFVLQDITLGVVYGLVVGYLASRLLPRGSALEASIPPHQRALYALGVAFLTYGLTTLPPHGNGVIAVFVCAIVLGIRRPDVRRYFESRADDIIEIVKLGVFVVFGSLLTFGGLFGDGWAAVGVVAVTLLVARTAAVWVALAGTRLDAATKAFMAWFGPKGVATMTFSLLVLGAGIPHAERIFDLAALAVVCSVIVHGVTDTPGSEWIARRAERAGLAVQRRLLLGGRERPGRLRAPLLAEVEPQLARWPQTVRMVRAERRARLVQIERAEKVAPEVALIARDLLRRASTIRHCPCLLPLVLRSPDARHASRKPGRRAISLPANGVLFVVVPEEAAKDALSPP
jgi:NhaP-type Na+/H+ or K+/H+ antiporter